MKREEASKGQRMLESMSYIDMDLVNAADEDRRRPSLDPKRWSRRILSRIAVAAAAMVLVMGMIFVAKDEMQWDIPPLEEGQGIANYADLICYDGQIYCRTETPEISEAFAVGEKIGKVRVSWIRQPKPDPDGRLSASVLRKGTSVYVWERDGEVDGLCARLLNKTWAFYEWEYDWVEQEKDKEPLDIKVVTPETRLEDTVYYLGGTYTRYLGSEILGGSHVGSEVIGTLEEGLPAGQGKHPAGTPVYEWSGYDPWYRIAVRSAEGGNYYYERWTEEELTQLTMNEYLPPDEQVTAISFRKRGGTLVGLITDPQAIRALLCSLREEAELSCVTHERVMDQIDGRYLELVLTDGSTIRFLLYDSQFGYSMQEFYLPVGFLEEVHAYEIYDIDERLGSVHYGSPLIAEWARPRVRKAEQWVDGQEVYAMGSVWVDGGRLCMGHGGCYGPLRDQRYTVLAEDVAGDLRMEDMEIWYRTMEGQVAYLYFWYPFGSNRLYEDLDAGVDFSPYIQEQRILYGGPVVKLQVRDGVVWTLDKDGVLRKETEIIAADVACFVLDASGAVYGTADGLYRLEESTGQCQCLSDGVITAVTSGGMIVYYVTAEDRVQSVWVDGTHDRDICAMDVREMHYVNMAWGNGFSTGMIRYEDSLILIDSQDRAWIHRQSGESILIGENVQTMQYLDEFVAWVQYLDGTRENINLLNYLEIH